MATGAFRLEIFIPKVDGLYRAIRPRSEQVILLKCVIICLLNRDVARRVYKEASYR